MVKQALMQPTSRTFMAGQLREYCQLDTLVMVKIVDALLGKIAND